MDKDLHRFLVNLIQNNS